MRQHKNKMLFFLENDILYWYFDRLLCVCVFYRETRNDKSAAKAKNIYLEYIL